MSQQASLISTINMVRTHTQKTHARFSDFFPNMHKPSQTYACELLMSWWIYLCQSIDTLDTHDICIHLLLVFGVENRQTWNLIGTYGKSHPSKDREIVQRWKWNGFEWIFWWGISKSSRSSAFKGGPLWRIWNLGLTMPETIQKVGQMSKAQDEGYGWYRPPQLWIQSVWTHLPITTDVAWADDIGLR